MPAEKNGEEQLVVFKLMDQHYGVNISSVCEIIRMERVTRIPRTPDFVEGVIKLRGKSIPVIDLRKRFGLDGAEDVSSCKIMVVEIDGMTVGLVVDEVTEVKRIPVESIEPPPPAASGIDAAFLQGIVLLEEDMIILLDLNKVLYRQEMKELASIEDELVDENA